VAWCGSMVSTIGHSSSQSIVTAQKYTRLSLLFQAKGRHIIDLRKTASRHCHQCVVHSDSHNARIHIVLETFTASEVYVGRRECLTARATGSTTARGMLCMTSCLHVLLTLAFTQKSGSSNTYNYYQKHPLCTSTRRSIC
jgi:hypothetical protein